MEEIPSCLQQRTCLERAQACHGPLLKATLGTVFSCHILAHVIPSRAAVCFLVPTFEVFCAKQRIRRVYAIRWNSPSVYAKRSLIH